MILGLGDIGDSREEIDRSREIEHSPRPGDALAICARLPRRYFRDQFADPLRGKRLRLAAARSALAVCEIQRGHRSSSRFTGRSSRTVYLNGGRMARAPWSGVGTRAAIPVKAEIAL